jgi:putative protease
LIGKVTHFFKKISVAGIELKEPLKVGDKIRIVGKPNPNTGKPRIDFTQTVTSMEIDHQKIEEAKPGDDIGLEVDQEVKEGCYVIKL